MTVLAVANIIAVVAAAWAVWEFGWISFGSHWDAPKATALVLFALGATLDSPWPALAGASFPLTGRYYFLTVIGHICYLAAVASGVKYIYLRLLPDAGIESFVRRRMVPAVLVAAVVMVVSFAASPLTKKLTADHLYLIRPDGWLTVYWLTYYVSLTALLAVAIYGVNRLRADPRSVQLNLLLAALVLGALSCVAAGVGILTDHREDTRLVAWPTAYLAIALGSVAVVLAWRHRVWEMLRRPREG